MNKIDEELLRECIVEMQEAGEKRYHHVKDSWMTMSKNLPNAAVFSYVKNGPIIKFNDSNRSTHEGILSSINYDRENKKYSYSVFTYEYPIMGEDKEAKKFSISASYLPDYKFEKFD